MISNKTAFKALKIIASKIEPENVRWMVFCSCGLTLNGMKIQPDDIDILTDEDGILKISQVLREHETEPIRNAPSEIFDSLMNKFTVAGCSIEVMSNFKVKSRTDGKWYSTNHFLEASKLINLDNFKIPVLPLLQSIELYKLMGRDKDLIMISKIEKYLMLN